MDELSFHLDEHIERSILNGLRQRGIDATITADVGLSGSTDEEQLAFAWSERRVLITRDSDFLALSASGNEHMLESSCPSKAGEQLVRQFSR